MLQNFKTAFLSLIISFTILFPVSTYILINVLENNPNKIKITEENSKPKYKASKDQDITVLLIISPDKKNLDENNILEVSKIYKDTKNRDDAEEKYLVLKISPHDNKVCLMDIPKKIQTIAQTNEGTPIFEGNLEEIYNFAGSNFLKSSIENITKIDIDNVIKLDKNIIDTIIGGLGGVITTKNKDNYIINNEEFYEYLEKNPKEAFLLLKNNFNNKTNLYNFFSNLSNLSSTDVTISDFQNRKKGFEDMIEKNNTKFSYVDVKTKKIEKKEKISDETLKEIEEIYK